MAKKIKHHLNVIVRLIVSGDFSECEKVLLCQANVAKLCTSVKEICTMCGRVC